MRSLAQGQGVTQQFAKANQAYNQGQLKSAYKQLMAIVRKYPDHLPSHYLLGRILFQQGRVGRAARHFKKVPADTVPPEAAYEYGITLFAAKSYKKAIQGFARVPAQSPYASVAAFYRGICYMRQGDYQRAGTYLTRAKKLPPNLVVPRRQALAQVRKQLRAERRGAAPVNPYFITPTPPPVYSDPNLAPPPPPVGPPKEGEPAPAPAPKKKAPPPSGFSQSITPGIEFKQSSSAYDYHGFADDTSESRTTTLSLGLKTRYDAEPIADGGQPYGSIGLDVSQSNTSTKGTKTKYVVYENDPGTLVEQGSEVAPTNTTLAKVSLNPELGYPISGSIDVTGGYKLSEKYPEMKATAKTSSRGPYGSLDLDFDVFTTKLSGSMTDYLDTTGKPTSTSVIYGAELSKSFDTVTAEFTFQQTNITVPAPPVAGPVSTVAFFGDIREIGASLSKKWETFSLTAGGTNTAYTAPPGWFKLEEDGSTKLELGLTRSFEFGGSISVTGSQTQLSAYKTTIEGKKPDDAAADAKAPQVLVNAQGTAQAALFTFKLAPLDWLSTSASYSYKSTAYTGIVANDTALKDAGIDKTALESKFQEVTAEVETNFEIKVAVSKTF